MQRSIRTFSPLPFLIGSLLWMGACALLTEDALRTGHLSVSAALMPLLTAATVASTVYFDRSLASLRLISATGFLLLAIMGTVATVYGTMGRQADARDQRLGETLRLRGQRAVKLEELESAKRSQSSECVRIGPRCNQWNARVDQLTAEVGQFPVVSADPRADAVVRLAVLFGLAPGYVRALIDGLEPVLLPLFLELGSVLFFAQAFPKRRKRKETLNVVRNSEETVKVAPCVYTQEQALHDFRAMRECGAQQYLADKWGRDKSTVSRWLKEWADDGLISRRRDGRVKAALALPLPDALALPAPR